jgi:hypothetical protein
MVNVTVPLKAHGGTYWGSVATPTVTVRKLRLLVLSLALMRSPIKTCVSAPKMSCSVLVKAGV